MNSFVSYLHEILLDRMIQYVCSTQNNRITFLLRRKQRLYIQIVKILPKWRFKGKCGEWIVWQSTFWVLTLFPSAWKSWKSSNAYELPGMKNRRKKNKKKNKSSIGRSIHNSQSFGNECKFLKLSYMCKYVHGTVHNFSNSNCNSEFNQSNFYRFWFRSFQKSFI